MYAIRSYYASSVTNELSETTIFLRSNPAKGMVYSVGWKEERNDAPMKSLVKLPFSSLSAKANAHGFSANGQFPMS